VSFPDPKTRFCNICGASSQETRFYAGVTSRCAECHMRRARENRAEKIDYYKEYEAKRYREQPQRKELNERYAKSQRGKEAAIRGRKKWIALNQDKRKAHVLVGNAVRDGRLSKPTKCQICGEEHHRIHGHHEDYTRPLDVVWVCPPCHQAFHRA
jgi:hypothetical protein